MKKFNLEYQYQLFLERMSLSEDKMHSIQKRQLRSTFLGACGQMLILLRDDLSKYKDDKAVDIMQDMLNQVGDYFIKITKKQN